MKVSLNWLKDYIQLDLSPEETGEILTDIGLEVEGIDRIERIKGGLKGVVAGKIKTCRSHPNADKLSLCTVDVGEESELQIVCGAPNVAQGQTVWVATLGTTLYTPEGEAWTIKKGKIRGEFSEGMICAEDELGLGSSHAGIMVLDNDIPAGAFAKDYYETGEDYIYEIGLTPNRSDATSHTGVAFDLAAYLEINHEGKHGIKWPDVSAFKEGSSEYKVEVKDLENCPRYSGLLIDGIKIGPSPGWMQDYLRAIGIGPKNNIVDITNFILHELGQPLHAFDADKIDGNKIIVKTAGPGEEFLDLESKTRKLDGEELMICDAKEKGMCIAGVFGGFDSGVSDSTTRIFLESAHFNAKSIRRTSTKHLLRTDAAVCFEKGSDPEGTIYALKRAALLMQEYAEGHIRSKIVDIYPEPILKKEIEVRYDHVSRLIGTTISNDEIKAILAALEMEINKEDDEGIHVLVPTNKADVTREADVIEEILRIYGYNLVPLPDKLRTNLNIRQQPDNHATKNRVADALSALGFNEMMALSLTKSSYFPEALKANMVLVNNTSNIHLDVMRPELIRSALEAVQYNVNRQQTDLRLYEFGRAYSKTEDGFEEQEILSLTISGAQNPESWHTEDSKVSVFLLKAYVNRILAMMGIANCQTEELEDENFEYGLNLHRGGKSIVRFGSVHKSLLNDFGIQQEVFFAAFDWKSLLKSSGKQKIYFEEISKYPRIRRDLAVAVDNGVKFEQLKTIAIRADKKLLKEVNLFDVYKNDKQLGEGKKSYAMSYVFESKDKTLKDKDVDKIMQAIMFNYEKELDAIIRK
jgi:phenylalanyl-tRNA synthetase beta chain